MPGGYQPLTGALSAAAEQGERDTELVFDEIAELVGGAFALGRSGTKVGRLLTESDARVHAQSVALTVRLTVRW